MTAKMQIFSRESEQAVLGSAIIAPNLITELAITADDFYLDRHTIIWGAIDQITQSGGTPDYVALCAQLDKSGKLKDVGGDAYITQLVSGDFSTHNAQYHADVIREKARRRKVLDVVDALAKAAFDETVNLDQALPTYVNRLIDSSNVKGGAVPFSHFLTDLFSKTELRHKNPSETWGIPTGFPTFDRITGGVQPGELWLLSGKPGVGKSMFAMQMAAQMAKHAPGVIYSMEMSGLAVGRRLVSGLASINTRAIKTGNLSDADWAAFVDIIDRLSRLDIFVSDQPNWTTTLIRADLARLKARHGVKWFVLDYLYLLNDGVGADEIERTALASKGLKRLCREMDMAGIVVHSMNKSGMDSEVVPEQGQLRGSGQVVYDADLVTFLTPYTDKVKSLDPDGYKIAAPDMENIRCMWFGKGRELEDARKLIRFVKSPNFPVFAEMAQI